MDGPALIADLLGMESRRAQHAWLAARVARLSTAQQHELAAALKTSADQVRGSDIQRCLELGQLIRDLAQLVDDPGIDALGLLALANAYVIGLGQFQHGIELYDQAAALYATVGDVASQAQSQIGKLWALASLGRAEEALAVGEWASEVLRQHARWIPLATLISNLAIIHGRSGEDAAALVRFTQAEELYQTHAPTAELSRLMIRLNRGIVLRNLGHFDESIAEHQAVLQRYQELGQTISVARAQQNLALTYFILGRYNEALELLDQAFATFLADGRQRHAMLVQLAISDCLLQLCRYQDALSKCRQARALFADLGTPLEIGQSLLNEATAYCGLKQYTEARAALATARQLFARENNAAAVANVDLQVATVCLAQQLAPESLELAQACIDVFRAHDLPIGQARAYLVAAHAALALDQIEQASRWVGEALQIGLQHNIPALAYQGHYLQGTLAVTSGSHAAGLVAYDQAVQDLERLCGRLMIEFRADFVGDKERLYEDTVALCLDMAQPARGLAYCERAKSRALLDMLAHRLDLSIHARSEADRPLVTELLDLRAERDRLYRRWQIGEGMEQFSQRGAALGERYAVEQSVLELEQRITELWHRLLIRNADYARDAALWQVRTEQVQPYLDRETVLLEFYAVHGQVVVFLVTADGVRAHRLAANLTQVQQLMRLFWLNLTTVPQSTPARIVTLISNTRGVLHKLYQLLLQPLQDELAPCARLIVVPHGIMHYLPFHALFDGANYALERYEFSYLPGASLLRYCREAATRPRVQCDGTLLLAVANSYGGRLPATAEEATAIAAQWQGELMVEDAATLEQVRARASSCYILHVAVHGNFRPDNPLFSGLALADGWLTTLDIFNLRLQASLVTLSACQTGRSVVGGGDELLGLMRAFLSAGAASLVTTLWEVEDRSTTQLMRSFYSRLMAGARKGDALRQAQLSFVREGDVPDHYRHPYFWAPFCLVGDAGLL